MIAEDQRQAALNDDGSQYSPPNKGQQNQALQGNSSQIGGAQTPMQVKNIGANKDEPDQGEEEDDDNEEEEGDEETAQKNGEEEDQQDGEEEEGEEEDGEEENDVVKDLSLKKPPAIDTRGADNSKMIVPSPLSTDGQDAQRFKNNLPSANKAK